MLCESSTFCYSYKIGLYIYGVFINKSQKLLQTTFSIFDLPKEYLMDLGYVTPMLTVKDLGTLENLDFDLLQHFSRFAWSDEQVITKYSNQVYFLIQIFI